MNHVAKAALRRVAARLPLLRTPLAVGERRRRREILQHPMGLRRPIARGVVVADKSPTASDVEIAARLATAYRAAARAPTTGRIDIWTDIAEIQQDFASVLDRGDADELAGYLCNVSRHDVSHGITQGAHEFSQIKTDRSYRGFVALSTFGVSGGGQPRSCS